MLGYPSAYAKVPPIILYLDRTKKKREPEYEKQRDQTSLGYLHAPSFHPIKDIKKAYK
jgi:hypothetical protein